jgi:hypothetical protein
MPAMRRLVALLTLLLLPGCAEVWTRPGTPEPVAEATLAACTDMAAATVPVALVWTIVQPAGYDRERRCWVQNGREVCRTWSRYRPARYGQVDINEGPRDAWRRQCMAERGFSFEGYRPLRLQ